MRVDEDRVNALFARYVERLVVEGVRVPVEELAGGDRELTGTLEQRIEGFRRIDEALSRGAEPLTGKSFGHYRIIERLGAGGMGEVYRAHDTKLEREVAIKVLPSLMALDSGRRARFEREAKLLAALNHPNIESIYGFERLEGLPFLVLELVTGETLAERIARGRLRLGEALRVMREVALALEAAHAKGIIHRDLKPANIKITADGHAKLLDFSLGKSIERRSEGGATRTDSGTVVGTASFMSPEQARSRKVDRRTDIWAFGCVFLEALTGRAAFPGESFSDILATVLRGRPDWKALPAQTPPAVRRLLRRCLEKDPRRRLADIRAARIGIEGVLGQSSAAARRVSSLGPVRAEERRASGRLCLRLLGPVEVEQGGMAVRGLESRRALALLGYLALQERAVARERLVQLFGEGLDEEHVRENLTRTLRRLSGLVPSALVLERSRVCFRRRPLVRVDAWAFEELRSHGTKKALKDAAALCRGELMTGVEIDDSRAFAAWLAEERERWRGRFASVFARLVRLFAARRRYEEASSWAERWIELDPLAEEAHRERMVLLARTGQRSTALVQYERYRGLLAEKRGVGPSEETKGLYERLREGGSATASLPAAATRFVGREAEIAEIHGRLQDPACRLLTLLGPGGIGKTALALEAARRLPGSFLDGVRFVSLSSLASPALLFSTLGDAFGLTFKDVGDPRARILDLLRDREMLLILDSFEHLVEGAEALAEILAAAPQVKLLVTSRVRLELREEWVREVSGLPCPSLDAGSEAEAAGYPAVQLFLEAAQRVKNNPLGKDALADVVRLVRQVEGMPLAIELAAGSLRERSCAEIASAVAAGLDLLTGPACTPRGRHSSVRASFEHSWRLLPEEERRFFRCLSLFRGGFRREAAKEVAGATDSGLSALVRSSFLLWDEARSRFSIHDLLRQFGEEKLHEAGEAEDVQRRFRGFFAQLLSRMPPLFHVRDLQTLATITEEIDNLRAAWDGAIESKDLESLDRALEGLWGLYEVRGWYREGEERLGRAVRMTDGLPRQEGPEPNLLSFRLLNRHAWFLHRLGLLARARVVSGEARAKAPAEGAGLDWEIALLDTLQSMVATTMGDFRGARSIAEQALARSQAHGNAGGAGFARIILGFSLLYSGAYDEADALLRPELAGCVAQGNERSTANCLLLLGAVASARGNHAEARDLLGRSLEKVRRYDDQIGYCYVYEFLGLDAFASRRYSEAARFHEDGLRSARRLGLPYEEAKARAQLGHAQAALGKMDAAVTLLREALRSACEMHAGAAVVDAVAGLAAVGASSDPGAAHRLLSHVLGNSAATAATKARARDYLARLRRPRGSRARRLRSVRVSFRELEDAIAGLPSAAPPGGAGPQPLRPPRA